MNDQLISPSGQPIAYEGIPQTEEPLLKTRDVAKYINMSEHFVRVQVMNNKIPHYKIGKAVRYKLSEIDNWLNKRSHGYTAIR